MGQYFQNPNLEKLYEMNLFYSDYYENTCVYTIKQDKCGLCTCYWICRYCIEEDLKESLTGITNLVEHPIQMKPPGM